MCKYKRCKCQSLFLSEKNIFFNIRTGDGENSKAIIRGAKFEVYL